MELRQSTYDSLSDSAWKALSDLEECASALALWGIDPNNRDTDVLRNQLGDLAIHFSDLYQSLDGLSSRARIEVMLYAADYIAQSDLENVAQTFQSLTGASA